MFDNPEGFKVDEHIKLLTEYIKHLEDKVEKLEKSNADIREFVKACQPQYDRFA